MNMSWEGGDNTLGKSEANRTAVTILCQGEKRVAVGVGTGLGKAFSADPWRVNLER